jgi:hypothetical protein
MDKELAQVFHGPRRGKGVKGLVAEREVAGADSGEEFLGVGAAHPGVDALRAVGLRQDSDQAFEAQIRGTAGVEESIQVGPEDAADAVAGAEPLGFGAAAPAGHVGGDAGAVPADAGPIGVSAREQPFFTAAGA